MGKKIDRFILSAAAAAAFYFYYQKAFSSRALSILLALISFIVFRKGIGIFCGISARFGWLERRKLRRQAGGAIYGLALLPEEEAQKKLAVLLQRCYGEESLPVIIQNHPSQPLSQQQIFDAWKKHRGRDKLVICATCAADAACRSMAAELRQPRCALIDAAMLSQMIAEHPAGFTLAKNSSSRVRLHFRHAAGLFLNRRNAPRCLLLALSMTAIYLLSGKALYLVCGMALFFAAFVSLKTAVRPAKLF